MISRMGQIMQQRRCRYKQCVQNPTRIKEERQSSNELNEKITGYSLPRMPGEVVCYLVPKDCSEFIFGSDKLE